MKCLNLKLFTTYHAKMHGTYVMNKHITINNILLLEHSVKFFYKKNCKTTFSKQSSKQGWFLTSSLENCVAYFLEIKIFCFTFSFGKI